NVLLTFTSPLRTSARSGQTANRSAPCVAKTDNTSRRPTMTTLHFLGAAGCVTGSRFILESQGDRVLVDCGLFQGTKELRLRNWAPFPVPPSSFKHVVLTHAHLDHSGYLPRLVKEGFRGTIF